MDVSVVIPLHDGGATIGETLDSLIDQGGVEQEVIVVDDRSTDAGPARARAHPLAPRLVESRAPGPAAARNTGFAASRGRYVVFLDADDLLLAGALAARLHAAERFAEPRVVVGQYADLVDGERRPGIAPLPFRDGSPASFLRGNRLVLHAALVPRSVLELDGDPFDERLWHGEDWGLWLRLACRGVGFEPLDVVDCLYRRRPGSLSTDRPRVAEDAITILARAATWVAAAEGARELEAVRREQLHRWHLRRARGRVARRAWAGAARDVIAAVAASPGEVLRWPRLLRRAAPGRDG